MTTHITITVASVPDRDDMVVELWFGSFQWGEIVQREGKLSLEIYEHPTDKVWYFDLEEVETILALAKRRLLDERG